MSHDPEHSSKATRVQFELNPIAVASTESRIATRGPSVTPINQGMADLAPWCDPMTTVAHESWMFRETSDAVLYHRRELPTDLIRYSSVEDAVLHARSLCEIFLCQGKHDTISLKHLIPGLDTSIEKSQPLREKTQALHREYRQHNGRSYSYETLFNTRVLHPTVFRGEYGSYREPLSRLRPRLLTIVDEIAALDPCFARLLGANTK